MPPLRKHWALLIISVAFHACTTTAFITPVSHPRPIYNLPKSSPLLPEQQIVPKAWQPAYPETSTGLRSLSMTAATLSNGKKRFATGMAFLTGWADVALYLKYETYASMMTGNAMKWSLAAAGGRFADVGYYTCVILSYMVGAAFYRYNDLKDRSLEWYAAVVSILFCVSDLINHCYNTRWIPMMMLAVGFGIANTIGNQKSGTLTFVITGHFGRLGTVLVNRLSPAANPRPWTLDEKDNILKDLAVVWGFLLGALWSAFLMKWFENRFGMFSSLGLLYGTLFFWRQHHPEPPPTKQVLANAVRSVKKYQGGLRMRPNKHKNIKIKVKGEGEGEEEGGDGSAGSSSGSGKGQGKDSGQPSSQ